jgi:Cdc6-like AAA superfamily ATPase
MLYLPKSPCYYGNLQLYLPLEGSMTQQDALALSLEAGKVFTPSAPIDERSLFAGRTEQVRKIVDAVNQKGQHAVVYGERGVGKTSLSNVLSSFLALPGTVLSPRVNCDVTDTFDSVWKKVFARIQLNQSTRGSGFVGDLEREYDATELFPGKISPDAVMRALITITRGAVPILIIDEFDRVPQEVRRALADTIKTLSDHAVAATVVLVGVAESLESLIEEHQSIERALVQIPMPRMSVPEIHQIIDTGLGRLGMTIDQAALNRISVLSQGLPHYAHLIGLYATRTALDSLSMHINEDTIDSAIGKAIEAAQQSVRVAYHKAIRSPRKDNLFADVLLACALAQTDELGEFAAQDVREPMLRITGKHYEIPSFAQHLNEFSESTRGAILRKSGTKRKFRYKFTNPLMQPYVIMQGFASSRMTREIMNAMAKRS